MVAGDLPAVLIQREASLARIHGTLGVTYKTAWLMTHRIRKAIKMVRWARWRRRQDCRKPTKLTSASRPRLASLPIWRRMPSRLQRCSALLSAAATSARSTSMRNVRRALFENLDKRSRFVTDGAQAYKFVMRPQINTSPLITQNSSGRAATCVPTRWRVSSSIFKRGMVGTYQHCKTVTCTAIWPGIDCRYNNRAKLGIDDNARAITTMKDMRQATHVPTA